MTTKTQDVTYLVNSKRSLSLQLGGNSYLIPSGRHTIYQLAEKLGVTEADAQRIADHAASTYSVYRSPSGAKERSNPPEAWVWFETVAEEILKPEPPGKPHSNPLAAAVATSKSDRLSFFQEFDS